MYLAQLRHFLNAIETGTDSQATAEGAHSTLQVIDAVRRSAAAGTLVEVSR
jgi:predicted dehydrogenase